MTRTKTTCLLVLAMIALLYSTFAFAQKQKPKKPELSAKTLIKLLDKTKPEIEKVLGKPLKSGVNQEEGSTVQEKEPDWCVYRLPGTEGVRISYAARGGGLPKTLAHYFEVSFEKGATWKKALEAFGIKSKSLKAKELEEYKSLRISGHGLKNWNLYFSGEKARYPDGKLINTNQGLPVLQIQGRSINEPDTSVF